MYTEVFFSYKNFMRFLNETDFKHFAVTYTNLKDRFISIFCRPVGDDVEYVELSVCKGKQYRHISTFSKEEWINTKGRRRFEVASIDPYKLPKI